MRSQTQRATKTAMNLTEWKNEHDVFTEESHIPDRDGYPWFAQYRADNGDLWETCGSTEFAACYALASKLEVKPPEET